MQTLYIDQLIENDIFKFNLRSRHEYVYNGFTKTKRGIRHTYYNSSTGKTYVTYQSQLIIYLLSPYF